MDITKKDKMKTLIKFIDYVTSTRTNPIVAELMSFKDIYIKKLNEFRELIKLNKKSVTNEVDNKIQPLSENISKFDAKVIELKEEIKKNKPLDFTEDIRKVDTKADSISSELIQIKSKIKKNIDLSEKQQSSVVSLKQEVDSKLVSLASDLNKNYAPLSKLPKNIQIKGGDNILVTKKDNKNATVYTIHQEEDNTRSTLVVGRGGYTGSQVGFNPTSTITSNTVQGAIEQLDSNKVNRIGDTMSGGLYISPTNIANGVVLLHLGIERAWQFRQSGAGAGSKLELNATVDSKNIVITSAVGSVAAEFNINNAVNNNTFSFSGSMSVGSSGLSNTFTKSGAAPGDEFFIGTNAASRIQRSAANSEALRVQVNNDSQGRMLINSSGVILFGPGNTTQDVNIYRSAANTLATDDHFRAIGLGISNAVGVSENIVTASTHTVSLVVNGVTFNVLIAS